MGGLNLNDASQFDKEQVQAELAENFEARETVSSGYVRFDHKFASDINLMAGLRMEHTPFVIPAVTMMMRQIRPPRPAHDQQLCEFPSFYFGEMGCK